MKILILLTAALSSLGAWASSARSLPISENRLRFTYGSQDGEISIPCTHRLQKHTLDWEVTCGSRAYVAHLFVTKYSRPTAPRQAYEILYWITDRQVAPGQPGQFVGTTTWVRLRDESAIHSLDVSQDVENTNFIAAEILF